MSSPALAGGAAGMTNIISQSFGLTQAQADAGIPASVQVLRETAGDASAAQACKNSEKAQEVSK